MRNIIFWMTTTTGSNVWRAEKNGSQKGADMQKAFERSERLLGAEAMEQLSNKTVAVFGIGGVGGYVVEALARTGIGTLHLIDKDTVSESNLNRQIVALRSTIGKDKTEVMKERVLDINPEANVVVHNCFFLPENAGDFDFSSYDYVVDAVDTVTAKLEIVQQAERVGVPVISCMGAGNKMEPTAFEVADIYETTVCPLAKVMRRELKKRGIQKLKVVYSREKPITPFFSEKSGEETSGGGRPAPGSVAFVPSVAGLILAGEVIKDLSGM